MSELRPVEIREDDALHLGVSWYPEMWPRQEWPKDIAKMQEIGISLVRLFEFAWKRFEPAEGEYDFDWALEVLDLLHAAGIRAMIGTPTAAPPAWLTTRYPDVLLTDAEGRVATHGKRKHYNPHSRTYLRLAGGIAGEMAMRLGRHPAVHSWQIDNEMSGFDYGAETRRQFAQWLRQRYGSIDQLNATWGLEFWSQSYDNFEQIPLCTAEVGSIAVPERHHPSLIMAIARFQNEAWTHFIRHQCTAIRAHASQPISSNMTGFINQMDWSRHFHELDRAGLSTYADVAYFHFNYIKMDRLRAEKAAPYWLLETAPNWSGGGPLWNIHHDAHGIRAVTWLSILLGGSMVLYWQWRSHWAGQEMQHGTCVSATGKWMPGRDTWRQIADEFAASSDFLISHPAQRGPIAIVADCRNAWLFSIDPIDPNNRYDAQLREAYYKPLVDAHFHRDIIHPDVDLAPYRLIICPHMAIFPKSLQERLHTWVTAGGQLLIGPLCGTRSEEMTTWTDREFGGLEDLMGATSALRFTPHWVEDTITLRFNDGSTSHPRFWCEAFAPDPDTRVLAKYEGGYGDGLPAVVERDMGKGRVITMGCPMSNEAYMALVRLMAAAAGIQPTLIQGEGVVSAPRVHPDGRLAALGLVNTRKQPVEVVLPQSGIDLLTGEPCPQKFTLPPFATHLISFE